MFRIALFVCPQTLCSSLGLAMDSFQLANRLAGARRFEVLRVSADGAPVALPFGRVEVEGGLDLAGRCDLLLIPATGADVAATLAANQALLAWLRRAPASVELGSLCSSAFLLAEAGVLDERRATLEKQGGFKYPASQTPWQEIQRGMVDQLGEGMVLKPAVKYQRVAQKYIPRDNH